LLKIQK